MDDDRTEGRPMTTLHLICDEYLTCGKVRAVAFGPFANEREAWLFRAGLRWVESRTCEEPRMFDFRVSESSEGARIILIDEHRSGEEPREYESRDHVLSTLSTGKYVPPPPVWPSMMVVGDPKSSRLYTVEWAESRVADMASREDEESMP